MLYYIINAILVIGKHNPDITGTILCQAETGVLATAN